MLESCDQMTMCAQCEGVSQYTDAHRTVHSTGKPMYDTEQSTGKLKYDTEQSSAVMPRCIKMLQSCDQMTA